MKFCRNCGAKLDDDSLFCEVCGTRVMQYAPIDSGAITSAEPEMRGEKLKARAKKEKAVKSMPNGNKKKRNKIILFSVLGVLVAALAVFLIIFNSPKYKVLRAADNTLDDLSEFFENCDNLMDTVDAVNDCIEDEEYSAEINACESWYGDGGYSQELFDFSLNYDKGDEILNGSINFNVDYEMPVEIRFSADDEQTMFTAPDFVKKVFAFNNETLGRDFVNSTLCEIIDTPDDFKNSVKDLQFNPFGNGSASKDYESAIKTFFKSVDVEKTNAYIPGFAGKVYCINYTEQDLMTLIEDCIVSATGGNRDILNSSDIRDELEDIRDELMDNHAMIYVGIESGKLAAVSVQIDGDTLAITLSGDNVWNSITIYEDGDEVVSGGIYETENGFNAELGDSDYKLAVYVDDIRGVIQCKDVYEEDDYIRENFAINYSCVNDAAKYSLEVESEYKIELSISPLNVEPTMLADSAVNIFAMSEDDFEDVLDDIFEDYYYYDDDDYYDYYY